MLDVKKLQAIRDRILGVAVNPNTYGDLNSVVYLQQILDAVKGTDPLNIRGNLAEHIYLQKILNAKRGVADGQFGSLPNSIYLQQLINAYSGVADGQFGNLPDSQYLDNWFAVASGTVTNPLLANLVLLLNCNELNGTRFDTSGRGHNAVETNVVTNDVGIVNRSAKSAFWNTNYLTIPYHADFALGVASWEMSFWFYVPDLTGFRSLITQGTVAGIDWTVWINSGGINPVTFQAGVTSAASTVASAINTWFNVHFGFDASLAKIFISVNNEPLVLVNKVGGIADNSRAISIGKAYSGAGAANNSRLDRIYRWNTVLTPALRTLDYNAGAPVEL